MEVARLGGRSCLESAATQNCHNMLAAVLQGFASPAGLQALLQLANPLVSQSLVSSNPALALLLAANAQSNAAARVGWPDSLLPTDAPSFTPAVSYLQHAALASSLHREEAAVTHPHVTAADLASHYMTNEMAVSYLNAAGLMTPRMASEPWLGLTDGLYQPSVPSQPHMPSNLHAGDVPPEAALGFGPQRHSHVRDIRHSRHSPY